MNENGEFIEVDKPNAYKFEAFIFDAFNYFDNISILRGKREEDFAPVKNKDKVDCPETAIKLYNEYWKKNNQKVRNNYFFDKITNHKKLLYTFYLKVHSSFYLKIKINNSYKENKKFYFVKSVEISYLLVLWYKVVDYTVY